MTTATTFLAPTEAQVGDYKFLAQMVKVWSVDFDFTSEDEDEEEPSTEEKASIADSACTEWVVEVEGDETEEEFEELLRNQITESIGWCLDCVEYDLISA